ncbi:MAG: DUF192 domain-containing protein [Candidatus Micrarchaeota archaeon]
MFDMRFSISIPSVIFLCFLFCFLFLLLAGCTKTQNSLVQNNSVNDTNANLDVKKVWVTFRPANVSILAEKADTEEKIKRGLMFRDSLEEKGGMLFYLSYNAYHSFWMVNTKIPLEAIFLDENFTIVDITEMEPCHDVGTATTPPNCTIYFSKWPSRYAIEVNQNFSKKYGIKEGDKVEVK